MSLNVESAFNMVLAFQAYAVKLFCNATSVEYNIKAAPSNYFRNMFGPEDTVVRGKEFVISTKLMAMVSCPAPVRGDKIIDPTLGVHVITEIKEMVYKGRIIGYRLQTA